MIPASGSAYTYSYIVFGELIAWIVGLVADPRIYAWSCSAVAVGWSGYAVGFLDEHRRGAAGGADQRARSWAASSTCPPCSSSPSSPAC